jgi:hypothetical protein
MGAARLLAKGWVLLCLFAGAHAVRFALADGGDFRVVVPQVLIALALFAAMGLLFVGGYGASSDGFHHHTATLKERKLGVARPYFNDVVLFGFAALSFVDQVWYAPLHITGPITDALENAIAYVVPGQGVIVDRLGQCALDGGRVFESAFVWMLGIVFLASSVSRLRQAADQVRLDRTLHPQSLSLTALAAVLGGFAIIGIQCLFVGSVLTALPCSAFAGIPGALLIGLGPLLLAYLIYAALAVLLASGRS